MKMNKYAKTSSFLQNQFDDLSSKEKNDFLQKMAVLLIFYCHTSIDYFKLRFGKKQGRIHGY